MKSLYVQCPECGARLEIDPATGEVLSHKRQKMTEKTSLEERLKALKKEKEITEDIFSQQLQSLKEKEKLLEEKFKKAVQDSKEREEEEKPLRDIDLD